jgi:serine/threonine protein kinase
VLADFGLALADDEVRTTAELAGSWDFMSPEQASFRSAAVDGRSDIYSLGVVFYRLLTGKLPFSGGGTEELLNQIRTLTPKPPRQHNEQIPAAIERICLKCLAKVPEDRYSNAGDLARDLRSALSGRDRTRMVRRGAIAICLVFVVMGIFWTTKPSPPEQPLLKRFEVLHVDHSGKTPHPVGPIDSIDRLPVRFQDEVQVFANFTKPIYVSFFGLDTDGGVTVYPSDKRSSESTMKLQMRYILNDGTGLQALFILGSTSKPLNNSMLVEQLSRIWQPTTARCRWRYDGGNLELIWGLRGPLSPSTRGKAQDIDEKAPVALQRVCEFINSIPNMDLIRAVAFPVEPKLGNVSSTETSSATELDSATTSPQQDHSQDSR